MIRRIDHTTITVSDLQVSIAFYTGLLGFVANHEMHIPDSGLHIVFLRLGNTVLELFDTGRTGTVVVSETNDDIGYKHICLEVDSVDREYSRLSAAGVRFTSNPHTVQGVRVAFLKDPDGMDVELLEYLPENSP